MWTWETEGVPLTSRNPEAGLDHVVLAGGTPGEWFQMTAADWSTRLMEIAHGAAMESAHWVTLLPYGGSIFTESERSQFDIILKSVPGMKVVAATHGPRYVWRGKKNVRVVIDPSPDGHVRFAATVESLRQKGVAPDSLTEELLSTVLLFPAEQEADLVVVLGSPERIPESMIWELAYSELVFIDISWHQLTTNHLELAIDDFNRRHRRFGGLDS